MTPSTSAPVENSCETCRSVVFTIANHLLALPLAAVLKVIPTAVVSRNDMDGQSLLYLDQQPISLMNLGATLSDIPGRVRTSSSPGKSGQFLLITGLYGDPQWAIPIDESPTLLELPLNAVRLLPCAYRESIHNLACHVAVLSDPDPALTILLLNLEQAARCLPSNHKTPESGLQNNFAADKS